MLTTPNMLADVYYVFQPMFGRDGNIVAVECLTRLTDAPLPMEEFFVRYLSHYARRSFCSRFRLLKSIGRGFIRMILLLQ